MMDNTIKKGKSYEVIAQESYEPNEIIVFDYQDNFQNKTLRVAYRVAGVPGDIVQIRQGEVYVNNKLFTLPSTAKYHYLLYLKNRIEDLSTQFDIQELSDKYYDAFLTKDDSVKLKRQYGGLIDSLRKQELEFNYQTLLNFQNDLGWDMHNFGPLSIPKVGSTVSDDFAKKFFSDGVKKEYQTADILVNDSYYFVVGDNFDNCTSDSRSIGLINKNQIVGRLKL